MGWPEAASERHGVSFQDQATSTSPVAMSWPSSAPSVQ